MDQNQRKANKKKNGVRQKSNKFMLLNIENMFLFYMYIYI